MLLLTPTENRSQLPLVHCQKIICKVKCKTITSAQIYSVCLQIAPLATLFIVQSSEDKVCSDPTTVLDFMVFCA